MSIKRFDRLTKRKTITEQTLHEVVRESEASGEYVEELLIRKGLPKHEILFSLSEYFGFPFVEYDERIIISQHITRRIDMERLKRALWVPLSVLHNRAEVIIYDPEDTRVIEDIKSVLGVSSIDFILALPSDLVRIIENNQDLNPNFPPAAGRTPLAKVRTFLAEKRSLFACYRTSFAKGRTGLAFLRTGISFIAIAVVFFRIFGIGYLSIIEALFLAAGIIMAIDGIIWYIPARKLGKTKRAFASSESTWGTTVLTVSDSAESPVFARSAPVQGADKLRAGWNNLSPVMRRRFLAGDRTDLAEERTLLAWYRTLMARARTGLAFARTGIAFTGLGIALLRQFHAGPWTVFDISLIAVGVLMAAEGFYWYFPGRHAGEEGFASVRKTGDKRNIWDFVFPLAHKHPGSENIYSQLSVKASYSPGIWATTGLALERTLLAERRNVMARLRTVMARSRTGMAFMRTGMSISAVGGGLLVYFGAANILWMIFNVILILFGLVLIADGMYWHLPAEKIKRQFPYCFGDMEITIPDYGIPTRNWQKVVFNNESE
jgi:uncharacterized membrane protein YidH (DUF202 family)